MKGQNEDVYQVKINYSYSYEIPEDPKDRWVIDIECYFKDYFPMSRIEIEYLLPEKSYELTREQTLYVDPFFNRLDGHFSLITAYAYEVPKNEFGTDDLSRIFGPNRETEKFPMILGFKTDVYIKADDSNEQIHKRVKEWVKDVVALVLHSPLLKVEKFSIQDYLIRDSKPKRLFKMRNKLERKWIDSKRFKTLDDY